MIQRPILTALPFLLALAACGAPEPSGEPADAGADTDAVLGRLWQVGAENAFVIRD